jgi:hypothetical protein
MTVLLSTPAAATPAITSTNYVIWGTGGVDPGHFYGARGIAVGPYGDLVYIADTGNNRIEVFTPEGIFLSKWGHFGKGSGDFDKPVAITTDSDGFVYVADNGNGLVQKFSETGTFVLQWSVPGVIGVAADKSGHVYALSSFLNLVSKRSTAGVSEGSWQAFKLSDSDGFVDNAARSIATDASGNVYVGDAKTIHWSPCHDGWPAPPEHATAIYKFTAAGSEVNNNRADSNPGPMCVSMAATYHDEYLDGVGVNPSDGWIYVAKPGFQEIRRMPPSLDYRGGDRMLGPRYPSPVIPDLDAVAFDCRGNFYALSRASNVVVKYLNAGADPIPCGKRPSKFVSIGDTRIEGGGVVVTIGCPAGHCKGTVTVKPSGSCPHCPFDVGRRGFDIPGGTSGQVTFPIDNKDKKAIKRKKKLPVIVTVVVGGKKVTRKDTLKSRSVLSIKCPTSGEVGKSVTVFGFLAPAHPGTGIHVVLASPAGAVLRNGTTNSSGRYEVALVPDQAGSWTAQAEWSGDADHEASSAGPCAFTVTGPQPNLPPPPPNAPPPPGGDQRPPPPPPPPPAQQPSSISISCPNVWQAGQQPFPISGSIDPPDANAPVSLTYRSPQNTDTNASVVTNGSGQYSDNSVAPGQNGSGTWTVIASWSGDATHTGSQTSCTIPVP